MAHELLGHALLHTRGLPYEAMQPGVEHFISLMEQEVP